MENNNFIYRLRKNTVLSYSIIGVIFASLLYGVIQMFFNETFIEFFIRLRMFTNISNLLAFLGVLMYFTKARNMKFYKFYNVIVLVAILMTGIIYHVLLSDGQMDFNNHIVHTINPILFPIFYYLFVTPSIKLNQFWVSLILPLLYFGIILLIGPFTNWYPYGFMNPTLPGKNLMDVIILCLGGLFPIICLFTVLLVFLKNKLEKRIR